MVMSILTYGDDGDDGDDDDDSGDHRHHHHHHHHRHHHRHHHHHMLCGKRGGGPVRGKSGFNIWVSLVILDKDAYALLVLASDYEEAAAL